MANNPNCTAAFISITWVGLSLLLRKHTQVHTNAHMHSQVHCVDMPLSVKGLKFVGHTCCYKLLWELYINSGMSTLISSDVKQASVHHCSCMASFHRATQRLLFPGLNKQKKRNWAIGRPLLFIGQNYIIWPPLAIS